MKIQLIRSATILLQYSGHRILIDPCFADKFSIPSFAGKSKNPLVGLPCPVTEIMKDIDVVLVSHLHSDHFDKTAQNFISKSIPVLCQPEDESGIQNMGFKNVCPVSGNYKLGDIKITRILGKHGEGEVLKEMGISSGFVFSADGEADLYWAGDTVLFDKVTEVLQNLRPKIVVTHSCGAVWGDNVKIVMDEVQTIEVCKMLPESIIIATHLDSFDHATVTRKQLRAFADKNNISRQQLIIPNDGDELVYKT
jgi:L-ascorbate metabolism protein UlaG (beta-lactamase superfamily)